MQGQRLASNLFGGSALNRRREAVNVIDRAHFNHPTGQNRDLEIGVNAIGWCQAPPISQDFEPAKPAIGMAYDEQLPFRPADTLCRAVAIEFGTASKCALDLAFCNCILCLLLFRRFQVGIGIAATAGGEQETQAGRET
jgi:hypothetical protein